MTSPTTWSLFLQLRVGKPASSILPQLLLRSCLLKLLGQATMPHQSKVVPTSSDHLDSPWREASQLARSPTQLSKHPADHSQRCSLRQLSSWHTSSTSNVAPEASATMTYKLCKHINDASWLHAALILLSRQIRTISDTAESWQSQGEIINSKKFDLKHTWHSQLTFYLQIGLGSAGDTT